MSNLRILWDNAADRATSLLADSTAGSLVAANMQNDLKGKVHRSAGTSVTYTLTWTNGESIGAVVLPCSNLSGDATVRVRGYDATVGGTLLVDGGTVAAAPGLNLGMWNWSQPINANAFSYGGVSKTQVWLGTHYPIKRLVIDLVDTGNDAGYIDCARIVAGAYFEATYNPSYGAAVDYVDTSENSRNDAGDLRSDLGTRHDTLTFDLDYMPEVDRAEMLRIVRAVGVSRNVVISVLPDDVDPTLSQDFCIFGKLSNSAVVARMPNIYSKRFDVEGW